MKTVKNNKAFTLIEMVVAIAIFTVFISMIAGTYLYVARAQGDTAEMRKFYSGARDVMEEIGDQIRLNSIYYGCYEGEATSVAECATGAELGHGVVVENLALIDGDELMVFYADEGVVYVNRYNYENGGWLPQDGFEEGAQVLSSGDFEVSGLYFLIAPYVDPALNYDDIYVQYQPHVTVYMDASYGEIEFPLQTSVSLRTY